MEKKKVFVFDLDGTLADHSQRNPYDEANVMGDKPIVPVFTVLQCIRQFYKVIFVSGRTDACYEDTATWLAMNLNQPFPSQFIDVDLYMRKAGDKRKDAIVKKEIYDEYILPYYDIVGVFDDRLQVCRMLYENNIFCFNVNQGLKEF